MSQTGGEKKVKKNKKQRSTTNRNTVEANHNFTTQIIRREKKYRQFLYAVFASTLVAFLVVLVYQWETTDLISNIITSISIAGFVALVGQFVLTILQNLSNKRNFKVCLICKSSQLSTDIIRGVQKYYSGAPRIALTIHTIEADTDDKAEDELIDYLAKNSNQFNGFIIRPIKVTDKFSSELSRLTDRKKKVVLVDRNLSPSQLESFYSSTIPAFVGSDFKACGKMTSEEVLRVIEGEDKKDSKILLLVGPKQYPSSVARSKSILWHLGEKNCLDMTHSILLDNFNVDKALERVEAYLDEMWTDEEEVADRVLAMYSGNDTLGQAILKRVSLDDNTAFSRLKAYKKFVLIGCDGAVDVEEKFLLDYYNLPISTIMVLPRKQGVYAAEEMFLMLTEVESKLKRVRLVEPKLHRYMNGYDPASEEEAPESSTGGKSQKVKSKLSNPEDQFTGNLIKQEKKYKRFLYSVYMATLLSFLLVFMYELNHDQVVNAFITASSIAGFVGLLGQFVLTILQDLNDKRNLRVYVVAKYSQFTKESLRGVEKYFSGMSRFELTTDTIEIEPRPDQESGNLDDNQLAEERMVKLLKDNGKRFDGFIIRPVLGGEKLVGEIEKIVRANKDVVLLDRNITEEDQKRFYSSAIPAFVGSDFSKCGELIADEINAYVQKKESELTKIVLLLGPKDYPSSKARCVSLLWHLACENNLKRVSSIMLKRFTPDKALPGLGDLAMKIIDKSTNLEETNLIMYAGNDSLGKEIMRHVSLGPVDESHTIQEARSSNEKILLLHETFKQLKDFVLIGCDGLVDVSKKYQLGYYDKKFATIKSLPIEQGRVAADELHDMLTTNIGKRMRVKLVEPEIYKSYDDNFHPKDDNCHCP